MRKKRNKWISKAFEVLGYKEEDGDDKDKMLKTFKDIDYWLKKMNSNKKVLEDKIEDNKDWIEKCENQIIFLKNLKNQAKIEKYKAMNPKAKAVYKL